MMSGVILISVRSLRACLMTSCPAACGIRWVKPSIATASPSRMAAAIASASDRISAPPYQSSSPHPAALRECTYRNDIDRPLSEQLCVLRSILQHFGGDGERPVRGRDARVDGDLQQHFLDLARRQAVGQRRPDVHGELLLPASRAPSAVKVIMLRSARERP